MNGFHCPECFEAEMELLQDVHIRQEEREIEKMVRSEMERTITGGPMTDTVERIHPLSERAQLIHFQNAYRAEKKRADEATYQEHSVAETLVHEIAENARLREAIEDAHGFLSEFEVTSDEDSLGKAYFKAHTSEDWYYILLNKLLSLTPSGNKDPKSGEIHPNVTKYGALNEWPS